jgi:negative regulator of sigma E activity
MNDKIKRIDEFKNTNEFKTIQNLLDKYMDGATSNEEEATLRKYFEEHANDIPEEWESYRALFSYIGFEQMNLSQILKEEEEKKIEKEDILEDEEKNIPKKEEKKEEASRSRWLKYFGTSVAAAAIIAFLIVGIQKIAQPQPECYAVIDGKVYTDQEFVHNEALDALEDVSADSEDPFSALDMMKQ